MLLLVVKSLCARRGRKGRWERSSALWALEDRASCSWLEAFENAGDVPDSCRPLLPPASNGRQLFSLSTDHAAELVVADVEAGRAIVEISQGARAALPG